jgi:hypothetical protein
MVTSQPTALFPAKVADLEILAHRADEASPFRVWRAQRRKGPRTMAVCSWKKQRTSSNYYKMVDCPTRPAWLQEVSQTSFRDVGSPAPIVNSFLRLWKLREKYGKKQPGRINTGIMKTQSFTLHKLI